ncbi:uncharacterized protein BO97DRAFT_420728 [Aspergillus homomorphus CBS 101889]|uniref:Uncharacterized protein n=1 Tax=Aspergillus homomorphus (strain CBS 101889) TaxID=1450537 RepID=A0A395IBC2_ASPHC|nr:hypothetical protein BO97DRAFT_420728 [Aspergillus homomorphus CBS 101889]RAL16423.1 hypothetical protein BO97DRAFT_420728 [Aspergillus homomorphus CBS 101889]
MSSVPSERVFLSEKLICTSVAKLKGKNREPLDSLDFEGFMVPPVEATVRDRLLKSVSPSVEDGSVLLGVGHGVELGAIGNPQALDVDVSIVQVKTEKLRDVALSTVSYISLTGIKVADLSTLGEGQVVLILDELESPIMVHPEAKQWETLKQIILQKQSKILWVTDTSLLQQLRTPNYPKPEQTLSS